jgi:alpha-galactosidase
MTTGISASSQGELTLELWVDEHLISLSNPFALEVNGRLLSDFENTKSCDSADHFELQTFGHSGALAINWQATRIHESAVWECKLSISNHSTKPLDLTKMDALCVALGGGHWALSSYRSAWGDEFRPVRSTTRHDTFLEVRSGRSSHGANPWLAAERESDQVALVISPAWSGNWHIRALSGGQISAGISPWKFRTTLNPDDTVSAPSVVLALGSTLQHTRINIQNAIREAWLPRTPFTDSVPVEWNHWWPYEDQEVNEQVIFENAKIAASLGFDIATTDAGWFGPANAKTKWSDYRGDWSEVNTARFPSGLVALGDLVRKNDLHAGIWVEAEAVGSLSKVRKSHPEAIARTNSKHRHDPSYRLMTESLDSNDPGFLGYICLGSEVGRNLVYNSIHSIISQTRARWLKLDFNVDPDSGCSRTDHGHGEGDGLFRHYLGLYEVLDQIRVAFPDLLLEACSSGGLRIDLGLARHVHCFFLSDPDYTEHHLEVLFGASQILPPLGILHWPWSQWRGDYPPAKKDWGNISGEDFAFILQAAMIHRFGISHRLPELRPDLTDILEKHVAWFKTYIAPMLPHATILPLTAPPERGGLGERCPQIQLTAKFPDGSIRHIWAGFQLDEQGTFKNVNLHGLVTDKTYSCHDIASERSWLATGNELSGENLLAAVAGKRSWLVVLNLPAEQKSL